jgi:hypothetical protein
MSRIWGQKKEPDNPVHGDLWVKKNETLRWNGARWVVVRVDKDYRRGR